MNWTQYPNGKGSHTQADSLLLMAYPDGSWAILDTKGGQSTGSYLTDPMLRKPEECNLEAAKAKAEAAADLMLLQYTKQATNTTEG
jgi:catalase (peroxidase I)